MMFLWRQGLFPHRLASSRRALHIGGRWGSRLMSARDKDLPRVEFSHDDYLNPVLVVTDRLGKLRMCDRLYDHWKLTQSASASWPLPTGRAGGDKVTTTVHYHEFPQQPTYPHEDDRGGDDDWRRAGGPTQVDVCVEDGTRVVLYHRGEFQEEVGEGPISIATWKALFDGKTYDEIWAKLQHNRRLLYHETVVTILPDFGAMERIWGMTFSTSDRAGFESMLRLQYPRAFCDENGELWAFTVSSDEYHFTNYDPVFERN